MIFKKVIYDSGNSLKAHKADYVSEFCGEATLGKVFKEGRPPKEEPSWSHPVYVRIVGRTSSGSEGGLSLADCWDKLRWVGAMVGRLGALMMLILPHIWETLLNSFLPAVRG